MTKLMTLDVLSSIKGAKSSDAVDELFQVIKNAHFDTNEKVLAKSTITNAVLLENLRDDEIIQSSQTEKELIKKNFPNEKNGFLVVSKVIDN
ncbi:MAG: hypothetical protein K9G44_05325 [Melioribacteraceae bacterium]|nr:hypothetical protein [Melioribacteraceae bacterium]